MLQEQSAASGGENNAAAEVRCFSIVRKMGRNPRLSESQLHIPARFLLSRPNLCEKCSNAQCSGLRGKIERIRILTFSGRWSSMRS